jgi:hypothetical protein
MGQVARPSADVSSSGWSPTPAYSHVNGASPNDGSPVISPVPTGGTFDVQLQPLAWPAAGAQTLTVRFMQTSTDNVMVSFFLMQGNQIITGRSVAPTQTFTNYDIVLSDDEIALIDDYTDLRVRVVAYGPGNSNCCPHDLVPLTLSATVTSGGICDGSYKLYGTTMAAWQYSGTFGTCVGISGAINLTCLGNGTWQLTAAGPSFYNPSASNCSPFQLTFTGVDLSACGGTSNATITVTP